MLMMTGLGDINRPGDGCPGQTHYWDANQQACLPLGMPQQSIQSKADVPWWGTILSSITQGVTTGLTADGKPQQVIPIVPIAPPSPWYMTPTGMIGLGMGALVLFLLLRK